MTTGDSFGQQALFETGVRGATVTSVEDDV